MNYVNMLMRFVTFEGVLFFMELEALCYLSKFSTKYTVVHFYLRVFGAIQDNGQFSLLLSQCYVY